MIDLKIVVLKFGGIAASTKNNREYILKIVQKLKDKKILIVISAMGKMGFPYATDTLNNLIVEEFSTNKEKDRLLACGEIISSVVLANQLSESKVKCYALSVKECGIRYENEYLIDVDTIKQMFKEYDVLVMPGFICLDKKDEIRTLNRGGSDLSACIVAQGLECKNVFLFKDVDGVYPFYSAGVTNLKPLMNISYDEALMMYDIGYKIIQKDAIEYARYHKLKIIVCNYITSKVGTIISNDSSQNEVTGLSFTKDTIKVAAFNLDQIKLDIDKMLFENRIFCKKIVKKDNFLEFTFGINQIQIAKKIIINKYFNKYLIQ